MATTERTGVVTFKGGPLTVLGPELKVGDKAPDASLLKGLEEVKLSSTGGAVRLLSVVPSLDTGICDAQTRRFNEEAANLSGVKVFTISMDLPFAQGRFCTTAGIENLTCLSDHRSAEFGEKYGVLIKELRLHARTIFVIGKDDTIKYIQRVPEVAQEPNFDEALAAVKSAAA
jgi:thiol peroxidase